MRDQVNSAVVAFPLDRVRPCRADRGEATAEVVIFTGVRIERMYDLAERLPSARSSSSTRARRGDAEIC